MKTLRKEKRTVDERNNEHKKQIPPYHYTLSVFSFRKSVV